MRGRTSCISPARIRSGRPESTRFPDLMAIPSSNVPALGLLPVGQASSIRYSSAMSHRRDDARSSKHMFAQACLLSLGTSPLRRGSYFPVCSGCNRPPNATRRHPRAMPTRGGIISRRRKGNRIGRTVGRMRLCGRSRGCFRASWLHISHFLVCRSVGRLLHSPALSACLRTSVSHPCRSRVSWLDSFAVSRPLCLSV
jgi:hypothetical protein